MIEQNIKNHLESLIAAALPGIPLNERGKSRSLVIAFERRSLSPLFQEQEDLRIYGWVTAVVSCTFFSNDNDWADKTELLKAVCREPVLFTADGLPVKIALSEADLEDRRALTADVLLFEVTYPLYDVVEPGSRPQGAFAGWDPDIGAAHEGDYERL